MPQIGMRPHVFVAVVALLLLAGCSREHVPTRADAVEQYFYAWDEVYAPAMQARGEERERRLRKAVVAFQAVVERFPDDLSAPTRALAEYQMGLCQLHLGETMRARDTFLRCRDYRRFAERTDLDGSARTTILAIVAAARRQLYGLR